MTPAVYLDSTAQSTGPIRDRETFIHCHFAKNTPTKHFFTPDDCNPILLSRLHGYMGREELLNRDKIIVIQQLWHSPLHQENKDCFPHFSLWTRWCFQINHEVKTLVFSLSLCAWHRIVAIKHEITSANTFLSMLLLIIEREALLKELRMI